MKKKKLGSKNYNTNKVNMPRVRKELIDADYLKDLTAEEKAWYDKFIGEYYGANLNFKQPRKNLHKSRKRIKDCTDRNNKQNNDLYGVTKINGLLDTEIVYNKTENTEYIHPANRQTNLTEDTIIALIDNKDLLEYDDKELKFLLELLKDELKE